MLYLSQLLGAPVEDQHSARLGKITDMLVLASQVGRVEATYPSAVLVADDEEHFWRVPVSELSRHDAVWQVRGPAEQYSSSPESRGPLIFPTEVSLVHDMLDKQVIDIEQKKALRVSEVCLNDGWRLLGVDHTALALFRRLVPAWLQGIKNRPATLIPWSRIELIGIHRPAGEDEAPRSLPLSSVPSPSGHLAELHPADIASIMHQLTAEQGARVLERLGDETAAATLEEIDTERQIAILENIQPDRAASLLQIMGPDEAADLLAQLPAERREQLLQLMRPEESEEVQELLEYESDTAGGLMTTDYLVLNQTRTAEEALAVVRVNILENDLRLAYIYCVADETLDEPRLLGVVSLWDLLVAPAAQRLQDLMETDLVTVQPESDPQTVAEIIAKYNLLALPVVNEGDLLQGVVTVDDALDVLLPADRRRKPRKMY
jgi:magnesium transporter